MLFVLGGTQKGERGAKHTLARAKSVVVVSKKDGFEPKPEDTKMGALAARAAVTTCGNLIRNHALSMPP